MTGDASRRIAVTPVIEDLARRGAWFVFSSSGGKDSGAAAHAASEWLDGIGHPRDRRLMMHADLGRAEWDDTLDTVRAVARRLAMPLEVVAAQRDLLWRFEDRWTRCLARYAALQTIAVPPPWPSSGLGLYCRSEAKTTVMSRRKARLPGDLPVVGVIGIRREESTGRANAAVDAPDGEMKRRNGRDGVLWNPLVDWTTTQVFDHHREHDIPLHRAYGLGSSRLSCALCCIASHSDHLVSVTKGGNIAQFRAFVALELRSGFSFTAHRWLADLVEDERTDPARLAQAKEIARERTEIQAGIPQEVLKRKSIVGISRPQAEALADARSRMGRLYGITVTGTTGEEIMRMSGEAT